MWLCGQFSRRCADVVVSIVELIGFVRSLGDSHSVESLSFKAQMIRSKKQNASSTHCTGPNQGPQVLIQRSEQNINKQKRPVMSWRSPAAPRISIRRASKECKQRLCSFISIIQQG